MKWLTNGGKQDDFVLTVSLSDTICYFYIPFIMSSVNNKRIAKNTLYLYLRMLIVLAISLYTVRAMLGILGVEDYGIYNVVAGVVSMFAFLNSSMAGATQRFLSSRFGRCCP